MKELFEDVKGILGDIEIAIGKVIYTIIVWQATLTYKSDETFSSQWDEMMLIDKFYKLLSYGSLKEHHPRNLSAIGLDDLTYFTFDWLRNYLKKYWND